MGLIYFYGDEDDEEIEFKDIDWEEFFEYFLEPLIDHIKVRVRDFNSLPRKIRREAEELLIDYSSDYLVIEVEWKYDIYGVWVIVHKDEVEISEIYKLCEKCGKESILENLTRKFRKFFKTLRRVIGLEY
ncbi:MAG: hypothetical protein QXP45_03305 [Thermoproteota archaeon]